MEEQYKYYMALEFWVCCELASLITEKFLSPFQECFEFGRFTPMWQFVSKKGVDRLKSEWPGIWQQFELDLVLGSTSTG